MFGRKKIAELEKRFFAQIDSLNNRIAVLEFKSKAENKKYIVTPSILIKCVNVNFLSADESKVITVVVADHGVEIKQNDKYLEFWSMSWRKGRCLEKVMTISDDKLVTMDVELYKKAFYPPTKVSDPIVKIAVESNKATEDLNSITTTVNNVIRS